MSAAWAATGYSCGQKPSMDRPPRAELLGEEDHQGNRQEVGKGDLHREHEHQVGPGVCNGRTPLAPVGVLQLMQRDERGGGESRDV